MDSVSAQKANPLDCYARVQRSFMGYIDADQVLDLLATVSLLIRQRSVSAEELLPDLDNYLRHVLAAEKLSVKAENRRKYYVERLDTINFYPPSLPPRPDGGLMKIPTSNANDDSHSTSFLHSSQAKVSRDETSNVAPKVPEPEPQENIYADMEDGSTPVTPQSALQSDMYLTPADSSKTNSLTADTQQSWSDSDGGTSYESYGEEDDNTYDNINTPEDVPLPRISKKKRKKKDGEPEMYISDLSDILFRGELYYKGSWQWNKRYCVISNNRLLVYKTEKAPRPIINIVLLGYNITYLEKEGWRNHVIRISHPGCESHFLGADLKEIANMWLEYLNTAACAEVPSSGDSANLPAANATDGSIALDQHSTSTGSEGGSGDGVVTSSSQQQQQRSPKSGDDKKQTVDKKKKNIISDFLSGTFGKKKSQKQSKKTIDISDITVDPQARISGILDVCHETLTKNNWSTRYCCVKMGQFECYHENASDGIELALPLTDADIQNASKETKKELSIKLLCSNGDYILLDTSDTIEHGKWLRALIMERTNNKESSEAVYENQDVMLTTTTQPTDYDSIYDEVYDVKITTGRGEKIDEKTAHALSQLKSFNISSSGYIDRVSSVARSSSNVSDSSVKSGTSPPPLPTTDPPKRPLPVKKRRSHIEDQESEISEGKQEMDFSAEMAIAFTQIKSQFEDGSISKSGENKVEDTTKSDSKGVIKCHSGPTIAEDKELLESTQNSILSVLRQEKRKGSLNAEVLNKQIDEHKQKLLSLKKQKSELRCKILTSRGNREKQRLEEELQNVDQMVETMEQELTKLQLLAQEKTAGSGLSRNGSFSTPPASRSNSMRKDSDQSQKSSPWSAKGSPTNKTVNNDSKGSSPKVKLERSASATKTTTAADMSKSWAKTTVATSSTTRQALAKFEAGATKQSTAASPKKIQTNTSNIRSGQKTSANGTKKLNGNTSVVKDSETKNPHRVVQERRKLWESMADGSN